MKTMTRRKFAEMVKDGRVEATCDETRMGFQEFRNCTTGTIFTVAMVSESDRPSPDARQN